jgi:pSer/pThr/pTyr-binding forkhead associated (FHA) protein
MSLTIRIIRGNWFRQLYKDPDNSNNNYYLEVMEKVKKDGKIEFIKDDEIKVKKDVVIGRTSDRDIILDDKKVSENHCAIINPLLAPWYIKDLNSKNGTLIKRENATLRLIDGEFPLKESDKIYLGDIILEIIDI